jgi:predicted helicase
MRKIDYFCSLHNEMKMERLLESEPVGKVFRVGSSRIQVYCLKCIHPKYRSLYESHANKWQKEVDVWVKNLRTLYINNFQSIEINDLNKLSGVDFEDFISNLFKKKGYEVLKTPDSGDDGVDLVITKKLDNKQVKSAIQCKRYKKSVGVSAVQEVFTGKHVYKCKDAFVITTSEFTAPAKKTAEKLEVTLWDKFVLLDEISKTFPHKVSISWDEYLHSYKTNHPIHLN